MTDIDPRLLAYAATFAYVQQLPVETTYLNPVARNAIIWRAVHAALDALPSDTAPPQDGPHAPQDGPEAPDAGAETPDGTGGRQAGTEPLDFDGCHRECRIKGAHTLVWGGCEHAPKPEPTVSMSVVYQDTDGYPSIGFDTYTVAQLAELIERALRAGAYVNGPLVITGYAADFARSAAHAIVHQHGKETP